MPMRLNSGSGMPTSAATTTSFNLGQHHLTRSNPNHLYMHQSHYHHFNCYHYYEELELAATRACASMLYCGHGSFKYMSNKNTHVFHWIDQLIECSSGEMRMYETCKYALPNEIYLLTFNVCIQLLDSQLHSIVAAQSGKANLANLINFDAANSPLFDKLIDKCYVSQEPATADMCFMAVAKVYTDYLNGLTPVSTAATATSNTPRGLKSSFDASYMSSIMTLCMLNIGSQRVNVHETSLLLLRAISNRFLQQDHLNVNAENAAANKKEETAADDSGKTEPAPANNYMSSKIVSSLLADIDVDIINSLAIYSKSQMFISEHLARKNPEQTMFVFLEVTSRFDKCTSSSLRRTMLNVLVPWLYNMQLIDPHVIPSSQAAPSRLNSFGLSTCHSGSPQATHLILNNLFYLTCRHGAEFHTELELLWSILALTWPQHNVRIIIRYLFIMCSLSTYEMLSNAKRVVAFLARACSQRVIDELVAELECMDSLRSILDCVDRVPFYAFNRPAFVASSHGNQPSANAQPNSSNSSKSSDATKKSVYDRFNDKLGDEDDADEVDSDDSFDDDDNDDDDDDDKKEEKGSDNDESSDESSDGENNSEDDDDDQSSGDSEQNEEPAGVRGEYDSNHIEIDVVNGVSSGGNINSSNAEHNSAQQFPNLPLPNNAHNLACPLNSLLFHTGHHHNQYYYYYNYYYPHSNPAAQSPVFSFLNNYSHHIHYQHLTANVTHLTRGHISLMLLAELVGTDGADTDWSTYMPMLLHYCLVNFDSPKQLVCEHAKKLLLGLLYVTCVQNELHSLTHTLLDSMVFIVDNQSIVFNRIHTNTNVSGSGAPHLLVDYANSIANFNPNGCHYSYYYNMRVAMAGMYGSGNGPSSMSSSGSGGGGGGGSAAGSISKANGSSTSGNNNNSSGPLTINPNVASPTKSSAAALNSPQHRHLVSTHSAPASPASALATSSSANSTNSNSSANAASATTTRKENKLEKAREHLKQMISMLTRSKCSPVWPHENVTAQTFSQKLTSVQLLTEFVANLRAFLKICSSTKQVSTISAAASSSAINFSTRLVSGGGGGSSMLSNIDKLWSQYALATALKTQQHYQHTVLFNRDYANRSLQIYRALGGLQCGGGGSGSVSLLTMTSLVQRLAETVAADPSENLQSYSIEILLTIKMNAGLLAHEYVATLHSNDSGKSSTASSTAT
jgi:hypothetical protein